MTCSGKYLEEELYFLVDMFVKNGRDQNYLNSLVKEKNHQTPKTESTCNNIVKL